MKPKHTKLTAKKIREALWKMRIFNAALFGKFVIMHPRQIEFYKRQKEFEPLSDYINEVKPMTGEVGRYDVDGVKIRIVQLSGFGGGA